MKYLLPLLLVFFSLHATAQNLRGTVQDEKNIVLANVAVFNSSTGNHTHTNNFGKFQLENVQVGQEVSFSHLGFQAKNIVVTPEMLQQEVLVVLQASEISLSQVVINSATDPLSQIIDIDLDINPVKSSQEILRSCLLYTSPSPRDS